MPLLLVLCRAVQVRLLEGDLNSDDLGLSAADQQKVLSEVEFVVHSAASIELEADVQHTLRSNYLGTQRLLRMATRMTRLRCFLHVSTAYVNVNQPRGSSVEERIYRLKLGTQPISHVEIVEDLLSLEPDDANCRVNQSFHAVMLALQA
jgi:fatty acyl-CoA reductase